MPLASALASPVLVTGASGFIGAALLRVLSRSCFTVRSLTRKAPAARIPGLSYHRCRDINCELDLRRALKGVGAVVHLAGAAHRLDRLAKNDSRFFRRVNFEGTSCLLSAMEKEGALRLIYLSTLKVHGDAGKTPFRVDSPFVPDDAYAASKCEAEEMLRERISKGNCRATVIRPPLVYGPGVKGNFLRLMKIIALGVPLPLAAIDNKRSLVSVANLCDLIRCCLLNDNAVGKTFMVSDGRDVSTPELVEMIAKAMKKKALLFPVSERILFALGGLLRARDAIQRLCGSLRADIAQTREALNWSPPFAIEREIQTTVDHWLKR